MLNVSSWSIRNPIPAILFFVLLTLAGIMAFKAMKIQQFMDIDLPTVTVTASLPGAAPAQRAGGPLGIVRGEAFSPSQGALPAAAGRRRPRRLPRPSAGDGAGPAVAGWGRMNCRFAAASPNHDF